MSYEDLYKNLHNMSYLQEVIRYGEFSEVAEKTMNDLLDEVEENRAMLVKCKEVMGELWASIDDDIQEKYLLRKYGKFFEELEDKAREYE